MGLDMVLRSTAASLALAGTSLLGGGALALEPAAVDAKFKDLTELAPVSTTGELIPLKPFGMVAFFSPLAADLFEGEWRKRPGNRGEFRVAPLSLMYFEAAFLAAREKNFDLTKAYVPDPAQIPAVVGLQLP